jgi:pilus assembly protein CpaB
MSARRRLVISIVCGLCAAIAMLAYVSMVRSSERAAREEALARYGGEQVEVYVAAHDIAAGDTIHSSDVRKQLWLADLLPVDCISSDQDVVGAVAGSSILANEPVSKARLGNTSADLSVPAGLNAVSIPMQDVHAVGGAISRGSLVDVYTDSGTGVRMLGKNLLVLDTSGSDEVLQSHSSLSWVTLAVTPESVQELLNASKSECLYLTLPSTEATDAETSSETTVGGEGSGA